MTKRLNIERHTTTSSPIDSARLDNEAGYYKGKYCTLMISLTGSKNYRFGGAVTETSVFTREVKSERTASGAIKPGAGFLIRLGGPFEEIGGDDEAVGGDIEKVD